MSSVSRAAAFSSTVPNNEGSSFLTRASCFLNFSSHSALALSTSAIGLTLAFSRSSIRSSVVFILPDAPPSALVVTAASPVSIASCVYENCSCRPSSTLVFCLTALVPAATPASTPAAMVEGIPAFNAILVAVDTPRSAACLKPQPTPPLAYVKGLSIGLNVARSSSPSGVPSALESA